MPPIRSRSSAPTAGRPPLDRAVALAEVDRVPVRVREHLHLDVPRILQVALDVDVGVREVRLALAARGFERTLRVLRPAYDPETLPAAACGRLDRDRPTKLVGHAHDLLG